MPVPHSKYSYSALELEAHALADKLADPKTTMQDFCCNVERAVNCLRELTGKIHDARGKLQDAVETAKNDADIYQDLRPTVTKYRAKAKYEALLELASNLQLT